MTIEQCAFLAADYIALYKVDTAKARAEGRKKGSAIAKAKREESPLPPNGGKDPEPQKREAKLKENGLPSNEGSPNEPQKRGETAVAKDHAPQDDAPSSLADESSPERSE